MPPSNPAPHNTSFPSLMKCIWLYVTNLIHRIITDKDTKYSVMLTTFVMLCISYLLFSSYSKFTTWHFLHKLVKNVLYLLQYLTEQSCITISSLSRVKFPNQVIIHIKLVKIKFIHEINWNEPPQNN